MITPTYNPTPSTARIRAELSEQAQHQLGASGGGGATFMATVAEVKGSTLVVDLGGGAEIEVIKPHKVCPALDQDVDGYTYAYSGSDSQNRTSTLGTSVENQTVVPAFIAGDVVEIGPAPGNMGVFAPSLAGYAYQVINHPAMWDKVSGS